MLLDFGNVTWSSLWLCGCQNICWIQDWYKHYCMGFDHRIKKKTSVYKSRAFPLLVHRSVKSPPPKMKMSKEALD